MPAYVALLRAVNVGGTGALAMSDLRRLCAEAGFLRTETYIASGNAVFEADQAEAEIRGRLERALARHLGAPFAVLVRSAQELAAALAGNPFPDLPEKFTYALFLPSPPVPADLAAARGRSDERLAFGAREIYLGYPSGMGRSKLTLPASKAGTARNMNTLAKLAQMALAR